MSTIKEEVILGALLHDIGKFYQRTGLRAQGYEHFTPEDYGRNGAHAKWSAAFIEEYLPTQWRGAAALALYHHAPRERQSPEQQIISDADALSAGIDREKRVGDGRGDPRRDLQISLLQAIFLPPDTQTSRPAKPREYCYPLRSLSLDRHTIFPALFSTQDRSSEYHQLWNSFVGEIRRIATIHTFTSYLETLLALLHKYTWAVPSASYVDYPDISLFDHSRTTAAIAACLYETNQEQRFLLMEGDLSGIQDFLYRSSLPNETRSGTAKRLRGRSFYLAFLTKTLSLFFLRELGLPVVNILWCSGGHFLLLLPDTSEISTRLHTATEQVTHFLWEQFQGDITFLLATVQTDGEGLKDFGSRIEELSNKLHEEKHRKQFWLFQESIGWLHPLQEEVCPVCQRDEKKEHLEEDKEGNRRCVQCQLFENIGQWLPRTRRLIYTDEPLSGPRTIPFKALGMYWYLESSQRMESSIDQAVSYRLVDATNPHCVFLEEDLKESWAYSFEFLANSVPLENNTVVEFSSLAERNPAGFLGVLRMDVDNLGSVFSFGLEGSDRSLSRMTTLSRTFDLFFSGYLNQIVTPHDIYITYAGGDDLFLVGSWEKIIEVACRIQEEFTAYCCHNPHLHLSGGMYLCKGKFPIARAATLSGEKLNSIAKAKARPPADPVDKNSLAFLEMKIPWAEFSKLKHFADTRLIPAIEKGKISRRLLYTLLSLYEQHLAPDRGAAQGHLIWVPKLHYILARNVPSADLRMELQQQFLEVKKWIPVLVGYVSLKTRNRENTEIKGLMEKEKHEK